MSIVVGSAMQLTSGVFDCHGPLDGPVATGGFWGTSVGVIGFAIKEIGWPG